MSGVGGFRGVSADQDVRYTNKQKKAMAQVKFPKELDVKVDIKALRAKAAGWAVIKEWIAKRVTQLLGGLEEEVLIGMIFNLLESDEAVKPKEVHISLVPFLEKNTSLFMKELWSMVASAATNPSGVPQALLDEKAAQLEAKRAYETAMQERIEAQRVAAAAAAGPLPPPPPLPLPPGGALPGPPPLPGGSGRSSRWDSSAAGSGRPHTGFSSDPPPGAEGDAVKREPGADEGVVKTEPGAVDVKAEDRGGRSSRRDSRSRSRSRSRDRRRRRSPSRSPERARDHDRDRRRSRSHSRDRRNGGSDRPHGGGDRGRSPRSYRGYDRPYGDGDRPAPRPSRDSDRPYSDRDRPTAPPSSRDSHRPSNRSPDRPRDRSPDRPRDRSPDRPSRGADKPQGASERDRPAAEVAERRPAASGSDRSDDEDTRKERSRKSKSEKKKSKKSKKDKHSKHSKRRRDERSGSDSEEDDKGAGGGGDKPKVAKKGERSDEDDLRSDSEAEEEDMELSALKRAALESAVRSKRISGSD